MSSPIPREYLTPEDYLRIERDVETRHEYYRGEMFAMGGASREHNLLSTAITSEIYSKLKDRGCEVYSADMRVKVSPTGLYTYPDVVVTCEKPRFEDDHFDTLLNPQVIVEVLSDSTETYDRGAKAAQYRQIESLQDYVLVSQKRSHIEHFSRQAGGGWLLQEATDLDGEIVLDSIGCSIKLADVYAKIDFTQTEISDET